MTICLYWKRRPFLLFPLLLLQCKQVYEAKPNSTPISIKIETTIFSETLDPNYKCGLRVDATLQNNSKKSIYFIEPNIEIWKLSNGGLLPIKLWVDYDINKDLGIIPNKKADEVEKNSALGSKLLSKIMQAKRIDSTEHNNRITSYLLAESLVFLNPGEKINITEGVSQLIKQKGSYKIVAHRESALQKQFTRFDYLPVDFEGYYYYPGRIISDTIFLNIE